MFPVLFTGVFVLILSTLFFFFFFLALSFKMCFILLRALVMCAVVLSFPTLLPTIILIAVHQGELPCFIFYERQSRITDPRFHLLWSGMVVRPLHPSRKIRNSSFLLRETVSTKPTVLATLLMYHPLRTKSIPGHPLVFSFHTYCL